MTRTKRRTLALDYLLMLALAAFFLFPVVIMLVASFKPDDGLIIRANLHAERAAFADNWPNRARFWFPSIDHPSDKATAAFTVDAPAPTRTSTPTSSPGPGPLVLIALAAASHRLGRQ